MNTFEYFQQEVAHLRRAATSFSQMYPNAARELRLSSGRSSDPDVEQLIQSFAYLTAQLRRDLAIQSNAVAQELLLSLYPNLARSVPCMAVLQARVEASSANFINGAGIAKGQRFAAPAQQPQNKGKAGCQFQASYHTALWPFRLAKCQIASRNSYTELEQLPEVSSVISLTIDNEGMESLHEYPLNKLRLYLSDPDTRAQIYHALQNTLFSIAVRYDNQLKLLPEAKLEWQGFEYNHNVLPATGQHSSYRILQEYFHFPEKFYFVDVSGLELKGATSQFELLLLLNDTGAEIQVSADSFKLNCFPAINLYPKTFKPISWDQTQAEYRIIADEQQYQQTEVQQITQVKAIEQNGTTQVVEPWLGETADAERCCYIQKLIPVLHEGIPGCDTAIAIYDPDITGATSVSRTLSIKGVCNNRRLPEWLFIGDNLKPIGIVPMSQATLVTKPTKFKGCMLDEGKTQELLSQMSLNLLSLCSNRDGLAQLKRLLLALCDRQNPANLKQITGLIQLKSSQSVRRVGPSAWRGHCVGHQFTLILAAQYFAEANQDLFGEVLSRVLGLFTTINHFTQLTLCTDTSEQEGRQWPPRIGEQTAL